MNISDLLFLINRALLGEVYSNIRKIAVQNFENENEIILRYYLYELPTCVDLDSIQSVAKKIKEKALPHQLIIHTECVYSTAPRYRLEPLSALVYSREIDERFG